MLQGTECSTAQCSFTEHSNQCTQMMLKFNTANNIYIYILVWVTWTQEVITIPAALLQQLLPIRVRPWSSLAADSMPETQDKITLSHCCHFTIRCLDLSKLWFPLQAMQTKGIQRAIPATIRQVLTAGHVTAVWKLIKWIGTMVSGCPDQIHLSHF